MIVVKPVFVKAAFALGLAFATPALAQVAPGQMAVIGKVDDLSQAQGPALYEAAMAACLAMGATPEVVEMVFTQAGWRRDAETSDAEFVNLLPPAGTSDPHVAINVAMQNCSIGAADLGTEAAQVLAKGLLDSWSAQVTTQIEGEAGAGCAKHEAKVAMPVAGTIYLSVLDNSGEDLACAPSQTDSLTTFAFVPN